MKKPSNHQLQIINLARFILPIILLVIVALYESWEHGIYAGRPRYLIYLLGEIFFFGIAGPTAVFSILSYVYSLLTKQIDISDELETLNYSLEQKAAERTEALTLRNEELARANAELKQLDQLKSDFVSLVNHELRGPLTTLNGGLEIAQQNSQTLPQEARRVLDVMVRESQKLTHFVQTILDISRVDAGKLDFTPGLVAIRPLLFETTDVVCVSKGRKINWNIPEGLPPLWADEIYLEKIICNLISNADKYSNSQWPIEVKAWAENGNVTISVADYGPGIPPEMQNKIFNRFERLEHGDCIQTKGWGLGLFFSRQLAELQGGELKVQSPIHDSSETPGAAFLLSMPIAKEVPEDA
ncbi:MAG: HAMP domain-containing histidine kinase [Anaerolineales bacterium]|nr:HAMP domain-containing histidine kinase [Anaerolineales bacterium]